MMFKGGPNKLSRRDWIASLSGGLGLLGLAGMLSAGAAARRGPAESARSEVPEFSSQGQTQHRALHGGRAFAVGHVRSQTRAAEASGTAAALGRSAHRAHHRRSAALAVRVQAARARRRSRQQSSAQHRFDDRRHLRDQVDVYVQPDAHAGAQPVSYREHRGHAPVDGSVDFVWTRQRESATCRASSCLGQVRIPAAGWLARASCPRSIRARASTTP